MAMKMGDKVEGSWRQFYVIILAMAAWGFTSSISEMILSAKLAVLFAGLIFTVNSCISLLKLYLLLSVLVSEACARVTEGHFIVPANLTRFLGAQGGFGFIRIKLLVVGAHSLCYLIVFYIFLAR